MGKWRPPEVNEQTADQRTDPRHARPRHWRRRDATGHPGDRRGAATGSERSISTWSKWRPPSVRPSAASWTSASSSISRRSGSTKATPIRSKIKEIRVRPKTGDHDIEVKVNKAREFLAQQGQGDRHGGLPRPRVGPRRGRPQGDRRGAGATGGHLEGRGPAGPSRSPHDLHAGAEIALLGRMKLNVSPHV